MSHLEFDVSNLHFVRFNNFISNYTLKENRDSISSVPHYISQLKQISETQQFTLNLDCMHLYEYDPHLYKQFIKFPSEMIPYFDAVVNQMYAEISHEPAENSSIIQVRPFNLHEKKNMRDLAPDAIASLISVKGIVIRASEIIPEMKEAQFK